MQVGFGRYAICRLTTPAEAPFGDTSPRTAVLPLGIQRDFPEKGHNQERVARFRRCRRSNPLGCMPNMCEIENDRNR